MNDSFQFYGDDPGEWFDGADGGHRYELHFRHAPDPAMRLAIARAFEETLAGGGVNTDAGSWLWAGPWALFRVGEAQPGRALEKFFPDMSDALDAVHEVAPLVEVHYANARASGYGDDWVPLSIRPAPEPAPAWPNDDLSIGYFGERWRRVAMPTSTDEAFEAERRRVRSEATARTQAARSAST
jgi:hypothetical protein